MHFAAVLIFNSRKAACSKFYPVNSKDPLEPIYFETAKYLWQTYVPISGQAETEQGELIRIIEKLDNEIRGNAKVTWDD